jgi:quercetin dioxygenase-like cupin family protein
MTIPQNTLLRQPGQGDSYWVLGDLYTFKAVGEETGQAYALVEAVIQPNNGTPLHIHNQEDEAFYVQEGEIEFQLDTETVVAKAGTFLHSPKGQRHSFKNIGITPAKLLFWVTPAGLEKFFAEIGTPANPQSAEHPTISPPHLETIMATASKYGLEIIPPSH